MQVFVGYAVVPIHPVSMVNKRMILFACVLLGLTVPHYLKDGKITAGNKLCFANNLPSHGVA
jgi:hypothetical protein